ncbi:hypothetical protein [Pseudomonas fluorescens]|uniref:DUF7079 family protein n=1 Tax=Pseudomonas fluorescens TaxID=294 RepID=UPI0012407EBE|nr:hypothetical protein [Pseudomonas fluorescens]VVP20334.1 hypothetical protein PS898_03795 [Pseudomonas fluorescens]
MRREPSPAELYKIRDALSWIFVDTAVDFPYIARQVEGYDPEQIKDILYSEVAVVCAWNLAGPLPPIWTGFDADELNRDIEEMLTAKKNSWLRRQRHRLHTAWLRFNYGDAWKELSAHLKQPN